MCTRIALCLLWCVVTILAKSTSSHLTTFYAKWGGKASFPSGTVDGIETYLYGLDEFLAGDTSSAKTRVDNFFSRFQGRSVGFVLQFPFPLKPGFFAGKPIAYSSLRMLKQTLDFAATKRISYAESARRRHFVLTIAVATCGVGKRAKNLDLTLEDIRVSIDPRVRANNYAGIRNSLKVLQTYLWAISEGAFVVDVVVKEISACVTLSVSKSGERLWMGVLGADLPKYMSAHVHPVTKQSDMVLFVYPTNRPTAQVFKDKKVEIITGGSLVGSRAITIMSDDSWFVEKPPHLGSGEWTEVERLTYLPQWYQHEVFHYLFGKFPQFKLEVSGHDWFNRDFWPSDFVHGDYLEADYFAACVNQRFIPRLKPGLGVSLLTGSPSSSPSQAVLSTNDLDNSAPSAPLSTSTPPTFILPNLTTTLTLLLVCSTFWIVFFTWRTVSARLASDRMLHP